MNSEVIWMDSYSLIHDDPLAPPVKFQKFWCRRCRRNHRENSVIGQRHFHYQGFETVECDHCGKVTDYNLTEIIMPDELVCEPCMDKTMEQ